MIFAWIDQFEARAQRLCGIERADSRDRNTGGRSTGNRGGGGGGRTAGGGGSGGATARALPDKLPQGIRDDLNKQAERGLDRITRAGGGTSTSNTYTPGAVPNFPNADVPTIAEKIVGPLLPGGGLLAAASMMADDGSLFGDPGPQGGWQPDRDHGVPNGIGGAQGTQGMIAGESYGAGTQAMTGDSEDDEPAPPAHTGDPDEYTDVVLQDRRKPRGIGAGTRMMMGV